MQLKLYMGNEVCFNQIHLSKGEETGLIQLSSLFHHHVPFKKMPKVERIVFLSA